MVVDNIAGNSWCCFVVTCDEYYMYDLQVLASFEIFLLTGKTGVEGEA